MQRDICFSIAEDMYDAKSRSTSCEKDQNRSKIEGFLQHQLSLAQNKIRFSKSRISTRATLFFFIFYGRLFCRRIFTIYKLEVTAASIHQRKLSLQLSYNRSFCDDPQHYFYLKVCEYGSPVISARSMVGQSGHLLEAPKFRGGILDMFSEYNSIQMFCFIQQQLMVLVLSRLLSEQDNSTSVGQPDEGIENVFIAVIR